MIDVRPASLADWPTVAALLAQLGRPEVLGGPGEAVARELFDRYLHREDTAALVAVVDGSVAGFVDLEFRERLNFTAPQAWIPDLIVAEAARGRGAGHALLARCEELARDRGCWSLSLESASWRDRAHAFYRREGLVDSALSFTRLLDPEVEWPPRPER